MADQVQFPSGELRLLCDGVAIICFNVTGGRGNCGFLPAAGGVLVDIGQATRDQLAHTRPDLAQLGLAEYSSAVLRNDRLTPISPSRG